MSDFRRLFSYLRPHLLLFILAIGAMIFTALFETAIGALLVPLLDQFNPTGAKGNDTLFNLQAYIPTEPWFMAWLYIAGFLVGFTVLKGVSSYISHYCMAKIGQSVVLNLRKELYGHLLGQSSEFFSRHRTNFLVSRIVISCAAIENAVAANLRDVLRQIFLLIAFVAAAFYFNWRLMLGALVLLPIIALLTSKFSSALRRLADVSLKGNQRLTDTAQETLSSQEIVKAYGAEKTEKARYSKVAELIARANLRSAQIAALSPPTIEIVGVIVIVIFFYFGLREIAVGHMEATQFFAFLFFLLRSYEPMRKISRQHNEIYKAFAAAQDVWDVLDEDRKLPVADNPTPVDGLSTGISLKDVTFRYPDGDKDVLRSVSLDIEKGTTVALVGESGGGKSSLIKLVQRLYDPTSGEILWDGKNLKELEPGSFREQFALVTQETFLFNETVAHNIGYGNPSISEADLRKAAEVAFADSFIEELPDGYETVVGERGTLLSGGQRQRLAIARAVAANSPVLILDEATSSLDTESEEFVKSALDNLMKGKTSIIIAHRLSTVRKADKIYVLDKGQIVESGNHDDLIEKGGKYSLLYRMQFADSVDQEN